MEELLKNKNEESFQKRNFSRKDKDDKELKFSVAIYPKKERIQLLDGGDKEIGYLLFSTDSKDLEKLRVQDMRITNPKEYGNNLAIELYEELLTFVKQNKLKGIKSDDVVYFGAVAVWKKLSDKGYSLIVNPDAQNEYNNFCEKYNKGEEYITEDKRLSAKKGASVFEINITL